MAPVPSKRLADASTQRLPGTRRGAVAGRLRGSPGALGPGRPRIGLKAALVGVFPSFSKAATRTEAPLRSGATVGRTAEQPLPRRHRSMAEHAAAAAAADWAEDGGLLLDGPQLQHEPEGSPGDAAGSDADADAAAWAWGPLWPGRPFRGLLEDPTTVPLLFATLCVVLMLLRHSSGV
eukprot:tig00020908_g15307.t1